MNIVREKYEANGDPGHDFAHICRVVENCRDIGTVLGAEMAILLPAAYLHDIINIPKNHPDRIKASRLAADEAKKILSNLGYEGHEIAQIQAVIVEHSHSLGCAPSSLESEILQDADRLDALGAVGIMRTVTCGARMGTKYYNLSDPWAADRSLDDKAYTVDHFFIKLLKMADNFNTHPGREEARRRTQFMRHFLHQLGNEIGVPADATNETQTSLLGNSNLVG
jgi:uncharacterized protein